MKVISYYDSDNQEYWLEQIRKSDWKAAVYLDCLISTNAFFSTLGDHAKLLLLINDDELVSFCTYAQIDDIRPTDLKPWMGFVYTFPAYRGHRYLGLLFDKIAELAREDQVSAVYLSTDHVGLYEKYGCEFLYETEDKHGRMSRVYMKRIDIQQNIEEDKMKEYIAYCGLDCETCEARIATINNDEAQREKVARLWSELNQAEITPEMINCTGCRIEGVKTPYCDAICPIRQCAMAKGFETCAGGKEKDSCEKLGMILANNEQAAKNLESM